MACDETNLYEKGSAYPVTEQIMRENLFVIAQAYSNATGLAMTTVSKKIHGNGEFFASFLVGKLSCGIGTYFLMIDKFRKAWPKNAKWPETAVIPRLSRTPYRPPVNLPERGKGGRFLGTKIPKRSQSR
jgi:hypothetical protein